MNINVLTPDATIFEGEITSVKVPGTGGSFEILANHAPIVSALTEGGVVLRKTDGTVLNFKVSSGFIEVQNNNVSLLVQGVSLYQK